jgi:hypothetical protein
MIPGKSRAVVSKNIKEFHGGSVYAHTLRKFGKARANAQAVAASLSNARKTKHAGFRSVAKALKGKK